MAAAEGEVQEKGYIASFPSLINVDGKSTYIMVLKDAGGLVKMYSMVNVEHYGTVAIGSTQSEVMANYKKLLERDNPTEISEDDLKQKEIVIKEIKYIQSDDKTYVYITSEDKEVFKENFVDDEKLIFLQTGNKIKVKYNLSEIDKLYNMYSYDVIK